MDVRNNLGVGATLYEGFANPVFDAQAAFRVIMDAMARPGTVVQLPSVPPPPAPLSPAAAVVLLTLCDLDTSVWLHDDLRAHPDVVSYTKFHTNSPTAAAPTTSDFAFVQAEQLGSLSDYRRGTSTYPDASTTVVCQLDTLTEGAPLTLRGPGIAAEATINPSPLPATFVDEWQSNRELFPCGIDIIFVVSDGRACCLPRTVNISEASSCMSQ